MSSQDDSPDPYDGTLRGSFEVQEVQRSYRPHVLEQVRGPGAPRTVALDAERLTVGRGAGCNVCINSAAVSRQHLLITRHGPEYACQDCDSSNGVYLNGVRIQSAVLREGDRLQIGDVVFVYSEGE